MLVALIYFLLFALLVLKLRFFKSASVHQSVFALVYLLKAVIAIGLCQWYYSTGFSGDMWVFYSSGYQLHQVALTDPVLFLKILLGFYSKSDSAIEAILWSVPQWFTTDPYFNDNPFMFRLNALMCFFSFGSFETHAVFFAFISMTGLTALFKTFETYCSKNQFLLFALIFMLPSELFWLSGIFKETILISVFALLLYRFRILLHNPGLYNLLVTTAWLLCLLQLKYYFILSMVPALAGIFIAKQKWITGTITSFIAVYAFFFVVIICIHYLMPDVSPFLVLKQKQINFVNYARAVGAGSMIPIPLFDGTPLGFITALPHTFINVFFRPFINELNSVQYGLVFIENTLLTLLVLFFISKGRVNHTVLPYCLALVMLSLSVLIISGLTTPVLGALVRYKSIAAPILYPALLLLLFSRKTVP